MSAPLDVLFQQRLLRAAGFYAGRLDGAWGPKTDAASSAWDAEFRTIREEWGAWDSRSEGHIATLLPPVQRASRRFLMACRESGYDVRILSGSRTYSEQNLLYQQGRTRPGEKVTNARGGESNHNYGIAFDVGVFIEGHYVKKDTRPYIALAAIRPKPLSWGGDWRKPDCPHYQLDLGLDDKEVRRRFETGELRA